MKWIRCLNQLPPTGVVVMTKIDHGNGARNEQPLVRRWNLWFVPDGVFRIYYAPTHWAYMEENQ